MHLVARLKNVRAILVKALDTIGEHPEILRILARSLTQVVRETLEETSGTLDSALEGLEVGDTVDEALLGSLGEVRTALEDVLERSDRAGGRLRRRSAKVRATRRRRLRRGCSLSRFTLIESA